MTQDEDSFSGLEVDLSHDRSGNRCKLSPKNVKAGKDQMKHMLAARKKTVVYIQRDVTLPKLKFLEGKE